MLDGAGHRDEYEESDEAYDECILRLMQRDIRSDVRSLLFEERFVHFEIYSCKSYFQMIATLS